MDSRVFVDELSENAGLPVIDPLAVRDGTMTTRQSQAETLQLPSNATSIREDITDNFSCENRTYGYYADVDNDCQVFHVCLPVTYADGKNQTFRWSFICPEETVFSQEIFVCVREEDNTIKCEDSPEYYKLNENFGGSSNETDDESMNMMTDGESSDMNESGNDMNGNVNDIDERTDYMNERTNDMNESAKRMNENMNNMSDMPTATPGGMDESQVNRKKTGNGKRRQNERRGAKRFF